MLDGTDAWTLTLSERAGAAIARSHTLTASSQLLCRTSRATVQRSRAVQSAGDDLRIFPAGFERGRIARPRRNRLAASTESRATDDAGASPENDACWAHRTVFGSRTVEGRAPRGAGTVDDPPSETWHVREIDARHIPGARADRCLVFENHERVRRLWTYPDDWETMPAAELLALAGVA